MRNPIPMKCYFDETFRENFFKQTILKSNTMTRFNQALKQTREEVNKYV